MGVISGILTVGFVVFVFIIALYCCCRVKQKRPSNSGQLPDPSPYQQTCHPTSPSTMSQTSRAPIPLNPYLYNPNNPGGGNFFDPHRSTSLFPNTSVPVGGQQLPYPITGPQGMPMPMPVSLMPAATQMPPANYPSDNNSFQPSAPTSGQQDDEPPPYHEVVGQRPFQPYS